MFKENTFQDKVALVTGGRSGIGYQIAKDIISLRQKVASHFIKKNQYKLS